MTDEKTGDEQPIRPICAAMFLSKASLWAIIPIAIVIIGAAITWALSTGADVSVLKSSAAEMTNRVDRLDVQINKKLDMLLERTK